MDDDSVADDDLLLLISNCDCWHRIHKSASITKDLEEYRHLLYGREGSGHSLVDLQSALRRSGVESISTLDAEVYDRSDDLQAILESPHSLFLVRSADESLLLVFPIGTSDVDEFVHRLWSAEKVSDVLDS